MIHHQTVEPQIALAPFAANTHHCDGLLAAQSWPFPQRTEKRSRTLFRAHSRAFSSQPVAITQKALQSKYQSHETHVVISNRSLNVLAFRRMPAIACVCLTPLRVVNKNTGDALSPEYCNVIPAWSASFLTVPANGRVFYLYRGLILISLRIFYWLSFDRHWHSSIN